MSPDNSERGAFTVAEFCNSFRVSRAKLYQLFNDGTGPRIFRVGKKVLISREAAAEWLAAREAASNPISQAA